MGSQLGVLRGLLKANKIEEAYSQLDIIEDKQFIGNSENPLKEDIIIFEDFMDLLHKVNKLM